MANRNPGTLETWLTDTQPLTVTAPKTGTTGGMETWLTDTQPLGVYTETAAAPASDIVLFRRIIEGDR